MERRDLLKTAGIFTLAGLASQALADQHASHAASSTPQNKLAAATSECVRTGEACLAHCIQMLSKGDSDMAACATSVNQLIPLCSALQNLASQDSSYTAKLAKVVMESCKECQKECEKFPQHAVCKACGEACAECYQQCQAIAA